MGTNRYSYSFNDPVNLSDPNGNAVPLLGPAIAIGRGFVWGFNALRTWSATTATVASSSTLGEVAVGAATAGAITMGIDAIDGGLNGSLPGSAAFDEFSAGLTQGRIVAGEKYGWANDALAATSADPERGQSLLDRYLGTAFTGLGTHANSLQNPNENDVYQLLDRTTGEVTKYGITSDLQGGRYTEPQLLAMGSFYQVIEHHDNRLSARISEVQHTLNFVILNGRFPRETLRW